MKQKSLLGEFKLPIINWPYIINDPLIHCSFQFQ
jgi:hypothetical protein